jgi:hypothetical protein
MELAEVDRALERPGEYFFEDGLWEITVGLWMAMTVALPLLVGGAAGNWSPVVVLLTSLGLRPAVLAAKDRWVHPRTGRVRYPDPEEAPPTRTSLGLSPAAGPVVAPVPRGRAWGRPVMGTAAAVFMGMGVGVSRRLGFGDAGGHLMIGAVVGSCLLVAAWRWRQRRWLGLAVALALLAILVASSGMGPERTLALHAAGIAGALVVSGTVAFVSYLRRAPKAAVNHRCPLTSGTSSASIACSTSRRGSCSRPCSTPWRTPTSSFSSVRAVSPGVQAE